MIMNKDSKTISSSLRGRIDTIKNRIRSEKNPFDGDSLVKKAICELRKEGVVIIRDKKKCRYYNPKTIDKIWMY